MGVVLATVAAIAAAGMSVLPGVVVGTASAPRAVVISDDGDYCAFNGVTDVIACVDDPADIELAYAATEAGARSALTVASVVLGRFYDDLNYGTASGFIDYLGAGACTGSLSPRDAGWSPLGTWANRISSFQGYNLCYIRLWTGTGYAGTALSYRTLSPNVGTTLNNNSQSIEFS